MSYTLRRTTDTNYDLEDAAGNVITSFSPPIELPKDIITAILDDMGIGAPQREAFRALLLKDWEIIDSR